MHPRIWKSEHNLIPVGWLPPLNFTAKTKTFQDFSPLESFFTDNSMEKYHFLIQPLLLLNFLLQVILIYNITSNFYMMDSNETADK